ncbi:MAG: methyltransferase [Elusimicrobia bacterium]|nr:methyltransferase [Elusimicrobiota bacterium]
MSDTVMNYDGGSFRDPDSRVFLQGGHVLRGLSAQGAGEWRAVSKAKFFRKAVDEGRIVRSEERKGEAPWELILVHERVPFVSYPYEWGFAMLQDAALLTLDLQLAALAEGFTLKDGSAYNVQFHGTRPIFIDVGSFERLKPGSVWAGYRQFCEQFLYPLMLRSYRGLPFGPWLRGRLEGIGAADASRLLGWRGALKPGVFPHVILQARLQKGHAADDADLRGEIKEAGFGAELLAAGLQRLRKLVSDLRWDPEVSAWSGYGCGEHYSAADLRRKDGFLREALGARARSLAWDLGANRGDYSRVLAETCHTVVALDADAATHEGLFRELRSGPMKERVLPLAVDLADPSPGQGWLGKERRRLEERGRPDFVLAFALLHHLRLSAGVPAAELADWLAGLGADAVVEFVAKEDPAARRLLARKDDRYADWTEASFQALFSSRFQVIKREALSGGLRVLFQLRPRRAA